MFCNALMSVLPRNSGHFLFDKNSGLNFRKLPVTSVNIFGNFGKEDNLVRSARYSQIIFGTFLPKFSVPFGFPPRIFRNFRLNSTFFENSTVFGLSGNFPWKFPYQISTFRNSWKFWLNGKCPQYMTKT